MAQERDVEKQVCRVLWEAFNDFFDDRMRHADRGDQNLLWSVKEVLMEALPYTPEEVRGD